MLFPWAEISRFVGEFNGCIWNCTEIDTCDFSEILFRNINEGSIKCFIWLLCNGCLQELWSQSKDLIEKCLSFSSCLSFTYTVSLIVFKTKAKALKNTTKTRLVAKHFLSSNLYPIFTHKKCFRAEIIILKTMQIYSSCEKNKTFRFHKNC